MTEPTNELPYWGRPEFHKAIEDNVPYFQKDSQGAVIANVNDHFFKFVDGELYSARVPADLMLPNSEDWAPVTEHSVMTHKARSMLGSYLDPQ